MTTPDVDELEKVFALPSPEVEPEEDYSVCRVYLRPKEPEQCGQPAQARVKSACAYGHGCTSGKCPLHLRMFVAGELVCRDCDDAGRPNVHMYPLSVNWES